MAELAEPTECCPAETQANCCEPEAKEECCEQGAGCGCAWLDTSE
jgi:hypothetical protein